MSYRRIAVAGLALAAGAIAIENWPERGYSGFFLLWIAALPVYVAAFPGRRLRRAAVSRSTALTLGALLLLGLALRLPAVDRMPPNIAVDELLPGFEAMQIAAGDYPNVLSTLGWFTIPGLAFAPPAAAMRITGWPPFFALRFSSVVTGMFGLLFVFLLARRLFNDRLALVATFLMAVSLWHIHNSRTGFPFVQTSCLVPGVLYLVVRAQQDRSLRAMAAAGLAMGLAVQGYFPVRALLLLVPLFLVSGWLRQADPWRRVLSEGLVLAFGVGLTLGPMFAYQTLADVFGRSQSVLITQPAAAAELSRIYRVEGPLWIAWRNLHEAAAMFVDWADVCILNRTPNGLLDQATLVAAVAGALIALGQARTDALMLVAWSSLVLLLGVAVTDAPRASYRLGPAMPALLMLAAFAIEQTLWRRPPRQRWYRATVLPAVLIGMGTWVGLQNYQSFFVDYCGKGDGRLFPMAGVWRYLYEHCDGRRFYVLAAPEPAGSEPMLDVMCREHQALVVEQIPRAVDDTKAASFLVLGWQRGALERLQRCYPGGRLEERRSDDRRYLFSTFEVDRDEVRRGLSQCGEVHLQIPSSPPPPPG